MTDELTGVYRKVDALQDENRALHVELASLRERLAGAAAGLPVCLCGFDGKTVSVGCPVHRADALNSR